MWTILVEFPICMFTTLVETISVRWSWEGRDTDGVGVSMIVRQGSRDQNSLGWWGFWEERERLDKGDRINLWVN